MIKALRVLYLLLVLFILSCNSNTEGCFSLSGDLFITLEKLKSNKLASLKCDYCDEKRQVIDSLSFHTSKILEMAGGIDSVSGHVWDACDSAKEFEPYFNDKLKPSMKRMCLELDKERKLGFTEMIENYLFNNSQYFTQEYFSKMNAARLYQDLLTFQLQLVVYIEE